MEKLLKDVPYLTTKLTVLPTHEKYGTGWRIHLRDKTKENFFVFLTERIVSKIGADNLLKYQEHIEQKKPPFFIFHGMQGKAYNVEFVKFSKYCLYSSAFINKFA